jgi:dCMP deaminase
MSEMSSEEKWDRRFLEMARMVAGWSKDPSTQCGAVIVRPNRSIASVGFNGFPRRVADHEHLLNDREQKYARVVHAEMNAILSAREPLDGYTLYSYPASLSPSCERCTAHIIQAGITRVVHLVDYTSEFALRWKANAELAMAMFGEAGVTVTGYAEREI